MRGDDCYSGEDILISCLRYHPFWKLASQMVFGVHLLAKKLAKSDVEVMKILQIHVDEMDGFIQRTTEDFLIIHLDVRTRIQYLSLPLDNLDVFDEMLGDRKFRLSLVAYNDQIEHAVDRFTLAIMDALKDLRKGKEAVGALWHYVRQLGNKGCFQSKRLNAFYQAMLDNMEGWIIALTKLRRRGAALQKALGQLAFAVTEMQRRVGVASRKDVHLSAKGAKRTPGRSRSLKQRLFAKNAATSGLHQISDKPLPRDPHLRPKTARPASRKPDDADATGKQAASTDATKSENASSKAPNRARSCSALVINVEAANHAVSTPPRTSERLTKKLSKPFLPKRSVSEKADAAPQRPSTAPGQTLKSRTGSIEQLKSMWASGRPDTQQSAVNTPAKPQHPVLHRSPDSSESMKDQISQYLKTDRVVEAWETITTKTGSRGKQAAKHKDWPSSIFRAKSADNLRSRAQNGPELPSAADLERQMSWAQEPELLNTYSFKQRPEISPRIHVLSVQMTLDDDLDVAHEGQTAPEEDDTRSIITALPELPPPTPSSIPSVS